MTDTGSAIADLLVAGGVRRFYTVPGESFLEILDGVDRHPDLRLISARHESSASFMAEADGKVTGRPAVVAATRGVGGSNLTIGVHTAYQDSTPMLVLLGQVNSGYLGREAFQEVDLPAYFAPITKYAVTAHRTDRIPELIAESLRVATSGRPGPAMINFPADVLAASLDSAAVEDAHRRLAMSWSPPPPDRDAIASIAEKLSAAERPVMIAGGGTKGARRELQDVAERYGLAVYSSFRRQDVFDNDHPQFLGHIGLGNGAHSLDALREADLVLVVGSRLNEITTAGYTLPARTSEVCQIDIDPGVIGKIATVGTAVVSDARAALQALLEQPAATKGHDRDWSQARQHRDSISVVPASRASVGCDPAQVIAAMSATFPADAILTNDAGNFSAFLHRHYRFTTPGSQVGPCNGAMGYGVPSAIGAKLASPDRTVVGVVGDGGFLMSGVEVETAVRYGLDLTIVVFRNGLHGTIAMHQARDMGRLSGVEISDIDVAAFARSLGASGTTVDDEGQLESALAEAISSPGVHVVDIITDPEVLSPDRAMSEMFRKDVP